VTGAGQVSALSYRLGMELGRFWLRKCKIVVFGMHTERMVGGGGGGGASCVLTRLGGQGDILCRSSPEPFTRKRQT